MIHIILNRIKIFLYPLPVSWSLLFVFYRYRFRTKVYIEISTESFWEDRKFLTYVYKMVEKSNEEKWSRCGKEKEQNTVQVVIIWKANERECKKIPCTEQTASTGESRPMPVWEVYTHSLHNLIIILQSLNLIAIAQIDKSECSSYLDKKPFFSRIYCDSKLCIECGK